MTGKLTVAPSKDHFLLDGKKFFLLADTFWSALHNPDEQSWEFYLNYRKAQGYNGILLSVNLMLDLICEDSKNKLYPFHWSKTGGFDYSRINQEFYERAKGMLKMAVDKGFIPILLMLHCRYTPGTWGAELHKEFTMPLDAVETYIAHSVDSFKKFHPIYIVVGDSDLKNEITLQYYRTALKIVKEHDPEGLTCFHLSPVCKILDEFANSELLDFYMLEPEHRGDKTAEAYKLPQYMLHNKSKKPIVNGEFFYDGHSHTEELYGIFNEFDQRRAIWQGILAGSKAGIGYGAHGLYSFHKIGDRCMNAGYGGTAYPWQIALQFEGGWEGPFAKYICEQYKLFDIEPAEIIRNEHQKQREEIRAAMSPGGDTVVVYIPYGVEVALAVDLSGYQTELIDLKSKHFGKPDLEFLDGVTQLRKPLSNADYLLIATK